MTVQAVVDCGSSSYIIAYSLNGQTHIIDLNQNTINEKQPSTAYISTDFTDVKQLPPDQIIFGNPPHSTINYAFFPNWKNYFFDADEIVSYPHLPSVPSKNHRSVRVTCASLFEGFMYQTVKAILSKTNATSVNLTFLIPSVAKKEHLVFIQHCIERVQGLINCQIILIYEAQAGLHNHQAIGDFGGFTFDKACKTKHEACNLAASNIDLVVDQLIKADFIDLTFKNRHILYQRILELKNNYLEGDLFLDLTSIVDPFELFCHYSVFEHSEKKHQGDIQNDFFTTLPYFQQGKIYQQQFIREKQQEKLFVEFRKQMQLFLKNLRKSDSKFTFLPPNNDFDRQIKIVNNQKILKKVLLKALSFNDFINDEEIIHTCRHMIEASIQKLPDYSFQQTFQQVSLDQWKQRLGSSFDLKLGQEKSTAIVKSYEFQNNSYGIVIPATIYKQILSAVCKNIAEDFGKFLDTNNCTNFMITGGFAQSPFLVEELSKIPYIQQTIGMGQDKLFEYIKEKLTLPADNIVKNVLMHPGSIKTQDCFYTHYFMKIDLSGELIYSIADDETSHKNRVCIDEGTSGSLLSYIPAGQKYADDMVINDIPKQISRDRVVDEVIFKAGEKTPSFCVVDIQKAFQLATFGFDEAYCNDKQNYQNIFDTYFTSQKLSLADIRRVFQFGNVSKQQQGTKYPQVNKPDNSGSTDVQPGKQLTAKEKLLLKKQQKQQEADVQPVIEPKVEQDQEPKKLTAKEKLALKKAQQGGQQLDNQVVIESQVQVKQENEFLIVDYWKRHLYQNNQLQFPLNPFIVQRYTFNNESVELHLPIAYFYISHLSHFYNSYIECQNDMASYYNQLGLTLTVPCAAKQNHLTFLRECARSANLPDDIVFVYEPNSAFAYMYNQDRLRGTKLFKDGYVLVVDVGGGTTDVSLLKINSQNSTFNVVNFYEINFAGNNVIDKVFEKVGITRDELQKLSSNTRSRLRESIKGQIELLTVKANDDTSIENIKIEIKYNTKETSSAEKQAYEEICKKFKSKAQESNQSEQRGVVINDFDMDPKIIHESIISIQEQIYKMTLDFSELNKKLEDKYQVSLVCAGGMGSSLYFRSAFEVYKKSLANNYITIIKTDNYQSAIARGGLYLKSEKDYVDFGAPLVSRGSEQEEEFIKKSEILKQSEMKILTFRNISLEPSVQEQIFIQKGKRWSEGVKGIQTSCSYNGIEFVIHVAHVWSVVNNVSHYFYLCKIPLEDVNMLHQNEQVNPQGVNQYLYDLNFFLSQPPNTVVNDKNDKDPKKPFAQLTVTANLSGLTQKIISTFDLYRYIPVEQKALYLEKDRGQIFISECKTYNKLIPYLQEIRDNYGTKSIVTNNSVLQLPTNKWRFQ